ncbi:hypothetical protein [Streptomyces sp. NPDC001135]
MTFEVYGPLVLSLLLSAVGPVIARRVPDRAVTRRIAALQTSPPPRLWAAALAVLLLGTLSALLAADATGDLLRLLSGALD